MDFSIVNLIVNIIINQIFYVLRAFKIICTALVTFIRTVVNDAISWGGDYLSRHIYSDIFLEDQIPFWSQ